ncbi:hypothetical protein [Cellulomonas sp. S1-8]|uniref:hypothetical protein n=1 Tax=Cellulomonas sp. S1-8 TaxID=2904790 RepID=UPI0022440CBA|nr:hypothetical protein [Cellulomonas sp. S1-8]UZN03044.1 hypothetical protein OKX07_18640 [Cellulomonas sp. S1-8]
MSRPYSWYPLATSDPVPGEPIVVRAGGRHYKEVATAIADAERVLRALVDAQDAVSQAVESIRDRTHAVADHIKKAYARYDAVGSALVAYADELDGAQSDSLDALRTAQSAQQSLDIADDAVRRWTILLDDAADLGEDSTTQRRALIAARADRSDADSTLTRARAALEEAIARRDAAADVAMTDIDTGTEDSLHDTWWEDWGADVAGVVSTWAGRIATAAGLLSLVLGWVPFLGQIFMVVAVVAGAAALVADFALALRRGDGEDWFNVVVGLIGIVSFSASRVLAKMVRGFDVRARAALVQAGRQTYRSLLSRLGRIFSRPQNASTGERSAELLWASAGPRMTGGAWNDVMALRGTDRALALAGHGRLVGLNQVLRAQLWDAFPFHPRAFFTLLGPTIRGTALETGAAVLYAGDGVMAMTSVTKEVVSHVTGPPRPAAERLEL